MIKRLLIAPVASVVYFVTATAALAAPAVGDTTVNVPQTNVPFTNLGTLIGNALAVLFFLAGLLAFFFIVTGGIAWITAGGDAKAAASARDRITAAVVGLLVVVAAFAITLILSQVFGISIFNFHFPSAPGCAGC